FLSYRFVRRLVDRRGRNAVVSGPFPRASHGALCWSDSISPLRARRWLADLNRIGDPATGHGDIFFLHHARRDLLRLRVSYQHHATLAAVLHISESAPLFSRRAPRYLPEGRGMGNSLAPDVGYGSSRSGAVDHGRFTIPQSTGLKPSRESVCRVSHVGAGALTRPVLTQGRVPSPARSHVGAGALTRPVSHVGAGALTRPVLTQGRVPSPARSPVGAGALTRPVLTQGRVPSPARSHVGAGALTRPVSHVGAGALTRPVLTQGRVPSPA